jgi:beta-glucanase (GH16 family)
MSLLHLRASAPTPVVPRRTRRIAPIFRTLVIAGVLGVALTTTDVPRTGLVAPQLPAPDPAIDTSHLIFGDSFNGSSLRSSTWNRYITSAAARGVPWNSNGEGGSSEANPTENENANYDLPSQVSVNNGLVITAVKRPTVGNLGSATKTYGWASGAVSTYGKLQFNGGYLRIVAKVPAGDGIWPAFWLLPGNGSPASDDYEIDIFEGGFLSKGNPEDSFAWHLHSPDNFIGGVEDLGADLTAGYHVFGLSWTPGQQITWYLDGQQVARVTSAQASIPSEPMELIISLGIANRATSGWHTVADASTPQRAQLIVRSVQLYR